jgi:DtxR family transcriptional regulator, Mn-dependent transcriptional regulator
MKLLGGRSFGGRKDRAAPPAAPHSGLHPDGPAVSHASAATTENIPLTELRVGESGEIAQVRSRTRSRLARLGTYGVVAGVEVTLVQKKPAFIIRVGETELALDDAVAQDILLHKGHRKAARTHERPAV